MSSSSARSSSPTLPSSYEFSQLILEPTMIDILDQTYNDQPGTAALLRHHHFITRLIQQMERQIDEHREERRTVFEHLLKDERFRIGLKPVTLAYRRLTKKARPHPYHSRKPTARKPVGSSSSSTRASNDINFDQMVSRLPIIEPPSPSAIDPDEAIVLHAPSPPSHESETIVQQQQHQPGSNIVQGSSQHPINVDEIEKATAEFQYPLICQRCKQMGHETDDCRTKMFHPTCERCGRFGHDTQQCDAPTQSFDRCPICRWRGKQRWECYPPYCPHNNVSKKEIHRIRGDILF